jgi:hypothetical protein
MNTIDDEITFNQKLEALRQDWRSLEYKNLGKERLRQMMNAPVLPRLAKRSWKENLLFGGKVFITGIVMIFFNAFGSGYTPIAATWAAVLLIDDYIGFRYLYFIPTADSVRETLLTALLWLRRLRLMYALGPVFIWVVFTLISPLMPDKDRALTTAFVLLPLMTFVCFLTWRMWTRRIETIQKRMQLFEE